jgi:uncharacterized coiled-coil protein SlyX
MSPSDYSLSPAGTVKAFAELADRRVREAAGALHGVEQAAARVRIDLDLVATRLRVLTEGLSSASAAVDLCRRAAAEAHRERAALDAELARLWATVQRQQQELRAGLNRIHSTTEGAASTAALAAQGIPVLMALHVRQTALAEEMAEVADRAAANVDRWRAMLRRGE